MLRGMYSSVSSMLMLQQRQSLITNNIANINTTGYKEQTLVAKSFEEQILFNKDNYKNGIPTRNEVGSLSFGVRMDDTITNFSQGTHVATENQTDFSLQGNGFFQVQKANGETFYTRDGSFKIDGQGYLVSNAGHYVMGNNVQNGNLERIYVGSGKISLTSNNNIAIDGTNRYSFKVVDFDKYEELNKVGENLYTGNNPKNSNNFSVRQGYLEGSNVDYIGATASLMETVKEFEANQKVIQSMDSILSKIANEIGTVR